MILAMEGLSIELENRLDGPWPKKQARLLDVFVILISVGALYAYNKTAQP